MSDRPRSAEDRLHPAGDRPRSRIAPARWEWHDGRPRSRDYGDIYHDTDGPGEVRRVFLEPANVRELARAIERGRSRGSDASARRVLRIAETGFGTGLNFACAVEALRDLSFTRLHFVSFEAHPISPDDFVDIAVRRAASHPVYEELAAKYPPLLPGWHRRELAGGRVSLSLFWGDAREGLADLEGRFPAGFDSWFLDGFAPDRNPGLWTPELIEAIGSFSKRGTTVATFTSVGAVRRALETAGFAMRKVDQRPHKRESLAGVFTREHGRNARPRGVGSDAGDGARGTPGDAIDVVGAGIAGASVARHLADRGCRVRVFERGTIASGASGIPTAVLHGRLLSDDSPASAWRAHAFLYSANYCIDRPGFSRTGALQIAGPNADSNKLARIAARYETPGACSWVRLLGPAEASELSCWPVERDALHFPGAGVVEPPVLCASLLDHPAIEVREERALEAIERVTVLACAADVVQFEGARLLEIAPIPGQIDLVRMSAPPAIPVVGNGYLAPGPHGVAAGTTYEYRPWPDGRASRENLRQLEGHEYERAGVARGVRAVSSDRAPIAGALDPNADPALMTFVSTGHGSMGMTTAHLAAAILAARITGGMPPVTREIEDALAPARFRERQKRRGYRHGAGG